jgi:hypothetical protein
MKKPLPIQISIPHPCNGDWNKMTPAEKGRFCSHCQKTVIDFTNYSDTALYHFFSKNTQQVCGRFTSFQLNRNIQLPVKPHSRLYKIAIALGLTLVFTQLPQANAKHRPPLAWVNTAIPDDNDEPQTSQGEISGIVIDSTTKEPIIGAIVMISQGGINKGGTVTDINGKFSIKSLDPGNYDITVKYTGYEEFKLKKTAVNSDKITSLELSLISTNFKNRKLVKVCSGGPLIDTMGLPESNIKYSSEQIEKLPSHHATNIVNTSSTKKLKKKHKFLFW